MEESKLIEMIKMNPSIIKTINNPTDEMQIIAIKNNEPAINFITNLNKNKMIDFLKANILVIKYISTKISKDELEDVLNNIISMDKIMFIYKYGSKKAKKITVDEKLKMI